MARYFVIDLENGSYISGHNSSDVAERKIEKLAKNRNTPVQAVMLDEWEQELVKSGDLFVVRDVPGLWYEIESNGALSNSAYHRCSAARWRCYYLVLAKNQYQALDDDPGEPRYSECAIPLRDGDGLRADRRLKALIKVGLTVQHVTISAGFGDDRITQEIDLSQLEPVRIIPESGAHP